MREGKADERCLSCRWAEIQPALFGHLPPVETCGHPKAFREAYVDDLDQEVAGKQFPIRTMRRGNFPCGTDAKLREPKAGSA